MLTYDKFGWPAPTTDPRRSGSSDLEKGVLRGDSEDSQRSSLIKTEKNQNQNGGGLGRLDPSKRFTAHQLFYIFVLDGVGGMTISAGVNFATAYAMYTTQDTTTNPIRLFQLPNTLAGDAAITIIIQCILTWFIELLLVRHDLAARSVQPIGFIREPRRSWLRSLLQLPPAGFSHSAPLARPNARRPLGWGFMGLVQQALRGFGLAVVVGFLVLWPVSVGVLSCLGEKDGWDYVFDAKWTPQYFKFILGGVLGLLTTPLMALFWLVRAGWEAKHGAA